MDNQQGSLGRSADPGMKNTSSAESTSEKSEEEEDRMDLGDISQKASSPQKEGEQAEVNKLEMDMETTQAILNVLLGELKDVMSEECFKSAQRLVESWRKKTPPDLKDLHEIFMCLYKYLLQKSNEGPNYSEKFEEPDNKAKPSSSSSSFWTKATVKVFPVVTGLTFGADQVILEQVKRSPEVEITRNLQECDFIIVFCPITSRVGSDVEAAMREDSVSSGGKPVILVLMHHTRDPDYSTNVRRWSETFQNVVLDVHVLFHETQQGLLRCSRNDRAVRQIQEELKKRSKYQTIQPKQEELKKRSKDQAVHPKQEEIKKRSKDQTVQPKQEEVKKRSKDQAVPPKQEEVKKRSKDQTVQPKQEEENKHWYHPRYWLNK